MQTKIPAVFMRGGTSRAVFFAEEMLAPYGAATRQRIVLAALGSPDPDGRQIDGLGGGISSLSKVAIIGRSREPESDVTFTFGQVDVLQPQIDWSGTCGNISSAVGPYAIDEGLVPAVEPITRVRVLATNTGKRYIAHVPVQGGCAETEGDYTIAGVPGPGACIALEFLEPGGSLGGEVLPTGMPLQTFTLSDGRQVEVSLVDASTPVVFVRARDVGAHATALAAELDRDTGLQRLLEEIRCQAAVVLGLATSLDHAHQKVKSIPRIAMVAPPASYCTSSGKPLEAEAMSLVARAISMGNAHRTYPGTVSMCTAVAAAIEGTVVHQVTTPDTRAGLRIGHPAGVMEVDARVERRGSGWHVHSVTTHRTARRIMEGWVSVPERYMQGQPWFEA